MSDVIVRRSSGDIRVTVGGGQGPRGFNGPDLVELAAGDGADLVGFANVGTGAVAKTMADALRQLPVDVRDYGAVADGVADDTVAIQRAMAASLNVVLRGTFKVSGSGTIFNVRERQRIHFDNAEILHATTTGITFSAIGVDEWAITGRSIVRGAGNASGSAAALYVAGCNNYSVGGFNASQISGWHIKVEPGTYVPPYADTGRFIDCNADECYYSVETAPGTGAEFLSFVAYTSTRCTYAPVIAAGNCQFIGGFDVQNTNGFTLLGGANNAHGEIVGRKFAHNTNYNFKADGVTNGQVMAACSVYADSSTAGRIILNNSKGVDWFGGLLDATIEATGTTDLCSFSKMRVAGSNAGLTGTAAAKVRISDCGTLSARAWALNETAPVELVRNTPAQSVSAGATTLIFTGEVSDPQGAHDVATGVFTAQRAGQYEIDTVLCVTAASGLVNGYAAIVLNNSADIAYVPILAISGTIAVGAASLRITLAAGDTIRLKMTITGTSPVLAANQSRLSIALVA